MRASSRTSLATVRDYWNDASYGEVYAVDGSLERQAAERYRLEPYLVDFARFPDGAGKEILEIGVGMGADHLGRARSGPRSLSGIDLTHRASQHTE